MTAIRLTHPSVRPLSTHARQRLATLQAKRDAERTALLRAMCAGDERAAERARRALRATTRAMGRVYARPPHVA